MDSISFIGRGLNTVERRVKSIVADALGDSADYLFMDWAQANVAIDKIERPTVVYILPPSGELDFSWREVKDYPEVQIAFPCSTEFDFEGVANDGIIEQMKRLCVRFIQALNRSGVFQEIEGCVPYQVLYDHLDHNVTGIVITITLEEVDGVSLC